MTKQGERVGHSGFGGFAAVNLGYCVLIFEVQCNLDIYVLLFICTVAFERTAESQLSSHFIKLLNC